MREQTNEHRFPISIHDGIHVYIHKHAWISSLARPGLVLLFDRFSYFFVRFLFVLFWIFAFWFRSIVKANGSSTTETGRRSMLRNLKSKRNRYNQYDVVGR